MWGYIGFLVLGIFLGIELAFVGQIVAGEVRLGRRLKRARLRDELYAEFQRELERR